MHEHADDDENIQHSSLHYDVDNNLDRLRWFSQRRSPTRHFWGVRTQGAITHKFELGRYFCTMHLPFQVSSSYVYSFGSYRVDKQTNKGTHTQTDAAENTQRSSLRYDVG